MWEFFQDTEGLWRWRCTRDGGQSVFNATRSYPTREDAVADARTRGYTQGAEEIDGGNTFVNLRALREIE
jgi:hypothetical protein